MLTLAVSEEEEDEVEEDISRKNFFQRDLFVYIETFLIL